MEVGEGAVGTNGVGTNGERHKVQIELWPSKIRNITMYAASDKSVEAGFKSQLLVSSAQIAMQPTRTAPW